MNAAIQREEAIFDTARGLTDPVARDAFLARACASEPDLRTRVERLLAAAADAEAFFAEGGVALTSTDAMRHRRHVADDPQRFAYCGPDDEPVGTRIGRYKLLGKIGEGGCGVVYQAEQEAPVRRLVALKIIKLGMETRSVIARFEAERQALAMMDHPNIARVFDAGATERGSPYFVMELVRGTKITDYCDRHRLDVRQRLDLFIQICHAIQHAHQKGVIHRDIKPSNTLVTLADGLPVPKVIDFGIAKATAAPLTASALCTAQAQLIGTPAYMSPEQAEMGRVDIDTRSDIYSLGVLLYEMLTGRTPFDAKTLSDAGFDEMRHTLRDVDPPRASQRLAALSAADAAQTAALRQTTSAELLSVLRGDLDWVIVKALEKDRTRRYETANGFVTDLQRHLHHEPVVARPPSRLYRFRKLVRRNRVVFVASAAVSATLVAGTGTSTWLYLKEREARNRAVAAEQQEARLRREAEARQRITQATLLVSQERFEDADRLLTALSFTQPTVEGAAVLRSIGEWHALEARWAQAADRFASLVKVDSFDGLDVATLDHLRLGPTLLGAQDPARYERFRQETLDRFAVGPCPFPDRVLKVCLLLPPAPAAMTPLGRFAEATLASVAGPEAERDAFRLAWRSIALALWEYRQGDYNRAVEWSRRCLSCRDDNPPRSATAHLILAMAAQQLGHTEDARASLLAARQLLEAKFRRRLDRGTPTHGFWFDWTFARVLYQECSGTVDARIRTP